MKLRGAIRYVVFTLAVVFVLLEVFLRIADPMGIAYFREAARYFDDMRPDDRYAYIHRANLDKKYQGVRVQTNSMGLRTPEFSSRPAPDKKRVMILGDSVVFGWGAPQASVPSMQLQGIADDNDAGWDVVGAGVGSWNTRNQYEFLAAHGEQINPDVIAWVVVNNDANPKRTGRTSVPRTELLGAEPPEPDGLRARLGKVKVWIVSNSFVLSTVRWLRRSSSTRSDLIARFDETAPAWRDVRDAAAGVVRYCREHDIDLVVFFYGDERVEFVKVPLDAYGRLFAELGVDVVRFPTDLYLPEYRNSLVDPHNNAAGLRVMAQSLYDGLVTRQF